MKLLRSEPALVIGALQALLTVAISFGLHWSVEQVGAVTAAAAAVLAVVVRQAVVAPDTAVDITQQAAMKTAAQLSNNTVGVAGSVTAAGEQIVTKTVAGVVGAVGGLVGSLAPSPPVAPAQPTPTPATPAPDQGDTT